MNPLHKQYLKIMLALGLSSGVIGGLVSYDMTNSIWTMLLAACISFVGAAIFGFMLIFIFHRWIKRLASVNLKDNPMRKYFIIYLVNGGFIVLSYMLGHEVVKNVYLGLAYLIGLICFFIDMYISKKYGKSIREIMDADAKIDEKHFTYQFLGLLFIILIFIFVLLVYIDIKLFIEFFLWLIDVVIKLF